MQDGSILGGESGGSNVEEKAVTRGTYMAPGSECDKHPYLVASVSGYT